MAITNMGFNDKFGLILGTKSEEKEKREKKRKRKRKKRKR